MREVTTQLSLPVQAEQDSDRLERDEWRKFYRIAWRFTLGLVVLVWGLDRVMGIVVEKSGRDAGISIDIPRAIRAVEFQPQAVRIIVLGDSVAKQLFTPGTEPGPDVRYLTTNAGITTAGQVYLALNAIEHCPAITDIYLFLLPPLWENDMPREFTHDYFCGHFHSAAQVAEVFGAKRDLELSFAHVGRFLLPNLMAANSRSQPATALAPNFAGQPSNAGAPPAADPERLLTSISKLIGPPAESLPPAPPGKRAAHFSPVSRYFYDKLRKACRQRGIHLHVLASPVSAERQGCEFIDPLGIYDVPIMNDVPADQLADKIHFKTSSVSAARKRVIEMYHLNFANQP